MSEVELEGDSTNGDIRLKHAAHSVLRERIVEHVFIGRAMQRLWQLGVMDVDVLRAEFDASGYDIVMSCGEVMLHIQFKASLVDGSRDEVNVNERLTHAPSGCVIWLCVTDALEIEEYRWFGAEPGRRLPDLSARGHARHTRGNSQGVKAERPNQRRVPKSAFEVLADLDDVLQRLFALQRAT